MIKTKEMIQKKISDFIKEHSKQQSFIRKLKNKYLGIKYKIEDWFLK
jgi:hypothetical protein